MKLCELTKQLHLHAYAMFYTYFISDKYLHMVYIISLKVIVYVS